MRCGLVPTDGPAVGGRAHGDQGRRSTAPRPDRGSVRLGARSQGEAPLTHHAPNAAPRTPRRREVPGAEREVQGVRRRRGGRLERLTLMAGSRDYPQDEARDVRRERAVASIAPRTSRRDARCCRGQRYRGSSARSALRRAAASLRKASVRVHLAARAAAAAVTASGAGATMAVCEERAVRVLGVNVRGGPRTSGSLGLAVRFAVNVAALWVAQALVRGFSHRRLECARLRGNHLRRNQRLHPARS